MMMIVNIIAYLSLLVVYGKNPNTFEAHGICNHREADKFLGFSKELGFLTFAGTFSQGVDI